MSNKSDSLCTVCTVNTHIVDHRYSIYKLRGIPFANYTTAKCAVMCNLNSNLMTDTHTNVQTGKALRRTWMERYGKEKCGKKKRSLANSGRGEVSRNSTVERWWD